MPRLGLVVTGENRDGRYGKAYRLNRRETLVTDVTAPDFFGKCPDAAAHKGLAMTLTLEHILLSAGLDPKETLVIRHAYVRQHDDGSSGIHADSSDAEIFAYTREQSSNTRIFPAAPPPTWVVFLPEGGDRARLWSVLLNHGETSNDGSRRTFEMSVSGQVGPPESTGHPLAITTNLATEWDDRG